MKKLAASLALALALASSCLIYPTTLEVEKIEGDTLYLTTAAGIRYKLDGAEDYEEGDLVSAIMFTKSTEKITDDVIIASRWSGYTYDKAKEEIHNTLWELCEEDEELYRNACSGAWHG